MGLFRKLGREVGEFTETAKAAAEEGADYRCEDCGERFHAEREACPECGAAVHLVDTDESVDTDDPAA